MGTKQSVAGSGVQRLDHLQPEGRGWAPEGQQQDFQHTNQITYMLRAGEGHQMISIWMSNKKTGSLTA